MPVQGYPDDIPEAGGWSYVSEFPVLGHIISSSGSVRACWQNTRAAMWRSFFGNAGSLRVRGLPTNRKFQLLNRCTTPILAHRCSRWPFNELLASEVKSVQFKMCSALVRTERLEDDSPASFKIRRNRVISQQAFASGSWVVKWCRAGLKWNTHLQRGVATSWIGSLLRKGYM